MRKFSMLLLLFAASMFGQRPVDLVLDSVNSSDKDDKYRDYEVCYHITNQTDKPVVFFLNTNSMVPVVSSSLSHAPHYKLYMDGKSVDVSGIFDVGETYRREFKTDAEFYKYQDSLRQYYTPEQQKKSLSDNIVQSKTSLAPNEKKYFSIQLRWDKQRYQKQDEQEYYLEPGSDFELELSMHLLREELESRLEPEAYNQAIEDPDFIKGWFTSNRLCIDLSESKMP
ncbi:hypothetical protein [Flavobacterium silvaticum]|uniref:DUF4412 domain-containing protein n=1 Tax=Flavobacterium silvaticum TaxID=1852020 RepID=A0A972FMP8_9FLAO|nr:hypothetical protein [Flavobacterium silvaticum]NMH28548.1 hypothetical protein [Flavobacterium silvaticum]